MILISVTRVAFEKLDWVRSKAHFLARYILGQAIRNIWARVISVS